MPEHSPNRDRRALITGVTGQDGSYLAELLLAKGYHVCGLMRPGGAIRNIEHLLNKNELGSFQLATVSFEDEFQLRQALKSQQPSEIYHLAAPSDVRASYENAPQCADRGAVDTARLLQAILQECRETRYFQAASAAMYGAASPAPWSEETSARPSSPHGVAKAFGFFLTRVFRERHQMFAANGILFNHESPRRRGSFVTRKIVRAAVEFLRGRRQPLALGNLNARRDWGYAGDYVEAMWRLLQHPEPLDYIIASGQTHSVKEWCEAAFAEVGLRIQWRGEGLQEQGLGPNGQAIIEVSADLFRPLDDDHPAVDISRAARELGWTARTSFQQLVQKMVQAEQAQAATRSA